MLCFYSFHFMKGDQLFHIHSFSNEKKVQRVLKKYPCCCDQKKKNRKMAIDQAPQSKRKDAVQNNQKSFSFPPFLKTWLYFFPLQKLKPLYFSFGPTPRTLSLHTVTYPILFSQLFFIPPPPQYIDKSHTDTDTSNTKRYTDTAN